MSFADEYMALRKKRLAEIKETGKMKVTPVESAAPTGGGTMSDFGAEYMALRKKRISDGYKALSTPPDLSVQGLRPFYDVTKDSYAGARKYEEIQKVANRAQSSADSITKFFNENVWRSQQDLDGIRAQINILKKDMDYLRNNGYEIDDTVVSDYYSALDSARTLYGSYANAEEYNYDRSVKGYQTRVEEALARGDWQGAGEHLRQMAQERFTPEERLVVAQYIDRITSDKNLYSFAESFGKARDREASEEAHMAKEHILDLADRGNWEELYNLMHSPEGAKYKKLLKDGYGIDADSPQSREQNYMGLVSQLEYGDEYGFNTLSKSGESYKTLLGTTAFTQRAAEEVQRAAKHEGSSAQMDSFTRAQTAYYVLDQLYDELGFGTDSVVTADNTRTRYLLKFLEEECGVDLTGLNASNGAEMIRKAQEEQGGKADLMNRTLKGQGYDTEVVRQYMENTVQQGLAEEGEKAFKDFWANASVWEKIGMNILSVPHKVFVSPLAAASQLGAMGGRGSDTDDPNSYVPVIARTDGATRVRTATDEDIDSGFWSFVYNAGMSAADSAANALAFGKGATFFMSLAGAGDTANEILARGGSREQALRGGIAAGAIEAMTEYFSIDQLLKGANSVHGLKSLMKSVRKQALTEGSEEISSEILNIIVDSVNMGNLSHNSQAVAEYMDQGLGYNEARSRVLLDNIKQVAESGLSGAVSGSMSASAYGLPSAVRGTVARKEMQRYRNLLEKIGELKNTENGFPNWEQYEQDHREDRFQYDPSGETFDQLEDMQRWRENTYAEAQTYTDQELTQAIEEQRAVRDDGSKDNKSRAIAQHHLDALELVQEQRNGQIKNAALTEQQMDGGLNYDGAEDIDDGGQRYEGMGTRGSVGGLEESTGRSIPRGQGKTEVAILEDLRENATAQSAREVGILNGSEEASLRVIPDEKIAESARWSALKAEAESHGHRLVLVTGTMETVDPVTKKRYAHEGIRQVDSQGNVTYYIKADKKTRSAEQIYRHEDFHDIVHNNPEILGDLVLALEMEYGRQEILGMVNRYVEAFDGIYGRIEETMTEEQENALIMVYMEEVFADVYGDIRRGNIGTASAQKIMRDQTDQVQRATQNRSATEQKTAPPGQRFSIEKVVEGEKGIYENCVVLDTDLFNHINPRRWGMVLGEFVYNNLAGQQLTMFDENGNAETVEVARANDRVRKDGAKNSHKVIDKLARYRGDNVRTLATVHLSEMLKSSGRESRSEDRNHQWMDENGWIIRHVYIVGNDGAIYDATLNIADGRDRRILYDINNIRLIDKIKGTAHGDVPSTEIGRGSLIKSSSFGDSLSENSEDVKQNFSLDDEVAELDKEYARKMAEGEEPRRGKSEPEWEAVRSSMDEYNAAAKETKEQRAEKNSITVLKNRIQKNEQMLRELSNMRTMAKKSNFLSMNMDKEIERRRGIIQETLEIDRSALKAKQEAKKQEDKSRKQKKQEEEIQKVKARKATEDMVTEVMELFFTKKGVKYEVREMLYELADQIVKDGRITDEIRDKLLRVLYENSEVIIEPDGYFGDIRRFVQHVKIYVPENVRTEFGSDWDSFRNAAFGLRIYLTNNPKDMRIENMTEELKEVFGNVIAENADLKEQLERIIELAEEGKTEKISLTEMMERNREDQGLSVEDQMDEMERKLDQILLTFSEKAGFEIDIKQKTLRKLNKQREEFRRILEVQRDRALESALLNQVRKRAQRLKAYYKRTKPSVRRMIDEQIGDLDTLARSISSKGLEDMQQILDNYNQTAAELGDAFIANPEIVARLERVKQRHLGDMSIEEVRALGEALTGIIQQIQNYNEMVSKERHVFITDMANRAQREIAESEGTKKTGYLRKFMMGQLNAKVFFGKISGYADGAWKWLSDRLEHGEEMSRQYQQGAMALFDTFLSDKGNQKWLKKASGKNAVWETVSVKGANVLVDGVAVKTIDTVELTPMMKVSLLMHSKNDDNLRHIGYYDKSGDVYVLRGGGVTIPDKELYKKGDLKEAYARGQVLVIPPDVIRTIAKNCTEQEKAFAALLTKYFDGMAKSAINEVSLQVDGWERACVQNYFPIQSDKAFIVTENGLIVQDLSLQGSSFLKERSHKGKNPMYLFDATDVLYRNIAQVSQYYGLTRQLRDLHAVMNATYYKTEKNVEDSTAENELLRKVKEQEGWGKVSIGSVEKALISKWGSEAKAYIERLSAHLQGGKSEGTVLDEWITALRGRYARSVISFNPSSVAKQLSSYPVAFTYLSASDLTRGLVTKTYFGNSKEAVMNLSKYSAVYWYRNLGNVNAEIKEYTDRKGTLERLPLGFQWTQMMDSAVTRRLLAACMHHVSKEMGLQPGSQESIDAGTDRYWSEVAKLFNKVVLDTQSNTSIMERPDIVRGDKNSVAKFITVFRTDAFQQHNLQVEARGMWTAAKKAYKANPTEANEKRLKAAKKHLAKTTAAVFMGQLTVGAITSLLAYLTFRDKDYYDEEGEFSWKKFLGDIVVNTAEGYAGMILGLDWISSLVESAIMGDKWYGPEVLGLESVKSFAEDVAAFLGAAVALDFQEGKKQLRTLAKSAGLVFGIPVSNIEKYLLAATRLFAPEFAERWENIWDETERDDLQYRSPRVIEEAISVLLDNRVDNLSDEDKAEIARLYIAGGIGAVPTAIPTSFGYTNEDGEEVTVTMSSKQKEKYREVWNEYATAGLSELLASEQYENADDEGKTVYIDKLYKFAGQMAKNAIEPKKDPEKWVQQGLDAQKNGVSLGEYVIFRVDLTGVSGKNEEGETVTGLEMQRSMELLEAMGWTDKQEKEIYLDVLTGEDPKKKEVTEALSGAGVPWEIVNDIVAVPGSKKDKFAAIVETKMSDRQKVKAMCVYASNEKEKKLLTVGLEYGVKPEWYAEVLLNGNADGKGIITQSEAKEYIDSMELGFQEKTILFQMVTDAKVVSFKSEEYPYWYNYGAEFWYAVHEDDPE